MASTRHEPPLKDEQIQKGDAQIQEQEEHLQEKETVHEQKDRAVSAKDAGLRLGLHEHTESELVETQKNFTRTSPSDECNSLRADLAKIKLDFEKSLDLRSLRESFDEQDKKIKALKAGYRELDDKISTMTEEREELEVSVKAVGAGIAETANFYARLQDDTTSMEAELEIKALKAGYRELDDKISTMTEEREELEVSVKAVGAGIAQTANFTARLKDDTTSMEAELERILNEQEDMKTHLSNLAVEMSSRNAEINDLKIKMKPLRSWCDAIERNQ